MRTTVTGTRQHRLSMAWRAALYLLLVLSPLAADAVSGSAGGGEILRRVGLAMGLTGFAMLSLQPFLSCRFKWFERPFGLDRLLGVHRVTGVIAALLVTAHPVFLALSSGSARLLLSFDLPWFLLAAKATLAVLLLFGLAALFHSSFRIPFQWWFRGHSWLTPVILAGIFLHSYTAAVRYQPQAIRIVWFALAGIGVFSYFHLTVYRRLGGRVRPWTVKKVDAASHDVWNIVLAPPDGREVFDYLPGQFLFVTLLRGRGLPVEEHPFSISSSPSRQGSISITTKESGDYTRTMGSTMEGDRAAIMAPYGRFSHLLHRERSRCVFIAGGIGITPLMSMLRHMRDTGSKREVLLLYACRTEGDIVFREELDEMSAADSCPGLTVVHILSRPDESWEGETGYIDRDKMERLAGGVSDTAFYICGPPPMMEMVEDMLTDMGAGKDDLHMERFSL